MFSSSAASKSVLKPKGSADKRSALASMALPLPASRIAIGQADFGLVERRKFIRPLPCPDMVETSDDATWSQWSDLMAQADKA